MCRRVKHLVLALLVPFFAAACYTPIEPEWRHGMYQGDLEVQGREYVTAEIAPLGQLTLVDHVGRFSYDGRVGHGLYEHAFIGPFEKYGMKDRADGAS